jgi:hypothetical protein
LPEVQHGSDERLDGLALEAGLGGDRLLGLAFQAAEEAAPGKFGGFGRAWTWAFWSSLNAVDTGIVSVTARDRPGLSRHPPLTKSCGTSDATLAHVGKKVGRTRSGGCSTSGGRD